MFQRLLSIRQAELDVIKKEDTYLQLLASVTDTLTELDFVEYEIDNQAGKFTLERKKMKGTELVEIVMALFEDLPELAIGISFAASGGLAEASQSDISLFVTSQVVSLFHAAKCIWSFWTLRKVIREAKLAKSEKVDTLNGYMTVRPISKMEETIEDSAAAKQLEKDGDAVDGLKDEAETARSEWEDSFKDVKEEIANSGSKILKDEMGKWMRVIEKQKEARDDLLEEALDELNLKNDDVYGTAGMASYNNPVYGGAAPAGADGGYLGAGTSQEYGTKKKKGGLIRQESMC